MQTLPTTPSFRLDGRRALVTGASSGIGLAAAVALAEAGAHVVMAARRPEPLQEAVDAVQAKGFSAEAAPLDIADTAAQEAFFAAHGPFHVLVNSAGTARNKPAFDTSEDDFDAVMDVNVKAAWMIAKNVAKDMPSGGSIVQISSQMGHVGGPDRTVYAASKHAVEGMTKAMAIEWAPLGIRVNTICPTFIRTPLTEPTFSDPERLAWLKTNIKLGRVGEVEDIMGAVTFLASDASALITGTAILVDGGWTAG